MKAEHEASQSSNAGQANAEHNKAIEMLLTAQEEKLSNLRSELETTNQGKIGELQKSHDETVADLQDQLTKAKAAMEDNSALEQLKEKVGELEQKLAENEKTREEAEKKAATASEELAGKHSSELSSILTEKAELEKKYQEASGQVEDLQKSLATSEETKSELETVLGRLSESKEELSKLRAHHDELTTEFEEANAQKKAIEDKLSNGEKDLNNQIDKNMSLLNQLGEVETSVSTSRRRVRELEMELGALKAERENSKSRFGLEGSRWATPESASEEKKGADATEGEDLGPSIQGTVGNPRYFILFRSLSQAIC